MAAAIGTVTADNEQVRVTTWTFGVGAGTGQHRHEFDYIVVPVTGGAFTVTDVHGRVSTMQQVAGAAYPGGVGTAHDVVNATGQPVSFVEVEMKVDPTVRPEVPTVPDRDRVLLMTSEIEVFALQLESMAVRHPQLAAECAALSGRMRSVVHQHRAAVREPPPAAREP